MIYSELRNNSNNIKIMSKFSIILIIGNIFFGGSGFMISHTATHIACETARTAKKTPSNTWVGTLDTPANEQQLSKYCYDVEVGTSLIVAMICMLSFTVPSTGLYFILKALKVI
jgi:hypothetical protein